MAIQHLTDGNPEGSLVGQSSTDKIGFYGLTTPIVRPDVTVNTTATATTALNEQRLVRLEAALVNLGLITTAG